MNSSETDPSIEDILSSIRQIMVKTPVEEQENHQTPKLKTSRDERKGNEDILELTEMVTEDGTVIDLKNQVLHASPLESEQERLISSKTANQTAQVFQDFSNFAEASHKEKNKTPASLEDMVSEILKPFLKSWLDQNLPSLVERVVQKEIEKIASRDN